MKSDNHITRLISNQSNNAMRNKVLHTCPTCKQVFKGKSIYAHNQSKCLKYPIKLVRTEKMYICAYECKAFKTRCEILQHYQTEHPDKLDQLGISQDKLDFEVEQQLRLIDKRKRVNTIRKRIKNIQNKLDRRITK